MKRRALHLILLVTVISLSEPLAFAVNANCVRASILSRFGVGSASKADLEGWVPFKPSRGTNIEQPLLAETIANGQVFTNHSVFHYVYGNTQTVELIPGYEALAIKDRFGNLHYLDPERTQLYTSPEVQPAKRIEQISERTSRKEVMNIDEDKIKNYVCAKSSEIQNRPDLKQLLDGLNRQLGDMRLPRELFVKKVLPLCLSSIGFSLGSGFYTAKMREQKTDNWISNHQSNFTEGIMLMSFFHACIGQMAPGVLEMTASTLAIGNIYSEVGFGQKKPQGLFAQPVSGYGKNRPRPSDDRVKTDAGDLFSGELAVAVYYTAAKLIENSYGFKIAKICQ